MALQREEHTSSTCLCSGTLTVASTKTKKEIKNVFCICKLSLPLEHWKGRRTKDRTRVHMKRFADGTPEKETKRKKEKGMTLTDIVDIDEVCGLLVNFTYF